MATVFFVGGYAVGAAGHISYNFGLYRSGGFLTGWNKTPTAEGHKQGNAVGKMCSGSGGCSPPTAAA